MILDRALLTGVTLVGTPNEASAQYREMRSSGGGGGAVFGSSMTRRMDARAARQKQTQTAARKNKRKAKVN